MFSKKQKNSAIFIFVIVLFIFSGNVLAASSDTKTGTVLASIDKYVKSEMKTSNIPGLALGIVKGSEVVYLKGFGKAGPNGQNVTPDTPFIIASLSKSITALSVMQLAEAGSIQLDQPVQDYIPWFQTADKKVSGKITLRQLLNQTSGFSKYIGNLLNAGNNDQTLDRMVQSLSTASLVTPPGEAFHYSNANYVVLADIVEHVSGQTYSEYVQKHIFQPLQMRGSSIDSKDRQDMAVGYQSWFGIPAPASVKNRISCLNNVSTVKDMTHYLIALMNGGTYDHQTVCSSASIKTMQKPVAKMNESFYYGMGFEINAINQPTLIKHPGDAQGFNANIAILPKDGWGIVLLENVNWLGMQGETNTLISGLENILTGREPTSQFLSPTNMAFFFDAIYLISIILLIISFARIGRWKSRIGNDERKRLMRRFIPIVLIDFMIPAGMLVNIPLAFAVTWQIGFLHAPDFCLMMIFIASLLIIIGIIRTVILFITIHNKRFKQIE